MAENNGIQLREQVQHALATFGRVMDSAAPKLVVREIGKVNSVGHGVARVSGLPSVQSEEVLMFPGGKIGMAFNLDVDEIGVILLNHSVGLSAGDEVRRSGRVLDVPVGDSLIGRIVDGVGRPLDDLGPLVATTHWPIERESPAIMERLPVTVPLQTGLKVVDTLIPIGRGQRQLILGDRQTGKTAIALDTILNQHDRSVICIYCAVGQRASAVARVVADLRDRGAFEYSLVVVSMENDPPGLQFVTPYAAMSMAEHFMHQGRDVLVVFDDLTRHARAYRELSLLLRRPPGREAYPGDIFYIHARLLERSTHLRKELGGGSLTALALCETEAQNLSAYIPTNLISITDGQIYLSPDLFQKGMLPAVDVGKSVSRVGGKTQLAAYRGLAGALRLAYAQFEELEAFARFGTRLDVETRIALDRGRRAREILKQGQFQPLTVAQQVAVLVTLNAGLLDAIPLDEITEVEGALCAAITSELMDFHARMESGQPLRDEDRGEVLRLAKSVINRVTGIGPDHAYTGEPKETD